MTVVERIQRRRSYRRHGLTAEDDTDPASGLVNLFDLWMVFAMAILVLLVTANAERAAAHEALEEAQAQALPDALRPTGRQLSGRGTRLGTAYRLADGRVVYVPEGD